MNSYIIDIDGTLSDHSHRLPFIMGGGKRDFDSYYEAMLDDPPLGQTCKLVEALADYIRIKKAYKVEAPYSLFVLTGRPEKYRRPTEMWLATYVPRLYEQMTSLYMRPNTCFLPNQKLKQYMLQQLRKEGYDPTIAIDDMDKTAAMWREEGLTCLQCA